MGLTSNIMSLTGIAISIGVLVDGAIVEVENAYKRLEEWVLGGRKGDFHEVRLRALKEVGPSVFFSLLVIAVAFMPIFTLVDQEGRLFKPLAYTKNLAMAIAAVLAITLDPAIRMLFTRMDPFTFRPRWLAKIANALAVGPVLSRRATPDQQAAFPRLRAGVQFRLAAQDAHFGHGAAAGADDHPRLFPVGLGVHAAVVRRLVALHAHDHAGHLGGRGPAASANDGPSSCASSPRWNACSARRAGRKPRPIPRRCRWSKPPSCSSPPTNGGRSIGGTPIGPSSCKPPCGIFGPIASVPSN